MAGVRVLCTAARGCGQHMLCGKDLRDRGLFKGCGYSLLIGLDELGPLLFVGFERLPQLLRDLDVVGGERAGGGAGAQTVLRGLGLTRALLDVVDVNLHLLCQPLDQIRGELVAPGLQTRDAGVVPDELQQVLPRLLEEVVVAHAEGSQGRMLLQQSVHGLGGLIGQLIGVHDEGLHVRHQRHHLQHRQCPLVPEHIVVELQNSHVTDQIGFGGH
mmetsp:Transcript_59789/g.98601  ORF Transcript_59789/g.98601 Transcript_59789/m.98601 type:complete len:215 (+) Transcript_59789:513-1157(+)